MIPKTEKSFMVENGAPPNIFQHFYKHTANNNHTLEVRNPNSYGIDCAIVIQAGSGDKNYGTYDSAIKWNKDYGWLYDEESDQWYEGTDREQEWSQQKFSHNGALGAHVRVFKGGVLILAANGGNGTPGYHVADRYYYWKRWTETWSTGSGKNKRWHSDVKETKNDQGWRYNGNQNATCNQDGESAGLLLTLRPNESISVQFIHNGANAAYFKGSVMISAFY